MNLFAAWSNRGLKTDSCRLILKRFTACYLIKRCGMWPNLTLRSTRQSTSPSPAPSLPLPFPWTLRPPPGSVFATNESTRQTSFFFFWQLLQSQKNKDPTQWSWSTPQLVKSVWPLSETNWSRMGETDPYASLWHFTDKSGVQALSFLHLSLLDLWIFYSH